ncbi:hypothetical protein CDL12_17966 [Handroanthus impetiginosus]|uniref:Protein CHAPERONE-LIKE PROTEIN OF POR1, chloroplastic n=1 Tax=Handroanthus impetiginosus TaxID=429701 RepID=A0A2G9GW30_9LAMI|nr:hypothetical protein CDL12_17966 [Handroanthus impetiginosus]
MATALSVPSNRSIIGGGPNFSTRSGLSPFSSNRRVLIARRMLAPPLQASSRADDPVPFEMSVENALKVLGVAEGASFDDILRAKNSIIASYDPLRFSKSTGTSGEQCLITFFCNFRLRSPWKQVEAAYDMLLMQSLSQRRAGKIVNSGIRFADVKPVNAPKMGTLPKWLQTPVGNTLVSIKAPTTSELGVQADVYGALMVLTYVNGASASSLAAYAGADVPGLILANSFGPPLYILTKRNVKLGKATVITIGGLVAGAVMGSAVESWLQVDVIPFMGIHTPATVVCEFILLSQFLFSLYLS